MKHIQFILVIFLIFGVIHSNKHRNRRVRENKYKNDLKVKHSLFREKDSLERMSMDYRGIPQVKDK